VTTFQSSCPFCPWFIRTLDRQRAYDISMRHVEGHHPHEARQLDRAQLAATPMQAVTPPVPPRDDPEPPPRHAPSGPARPAAPRFDPRRRRRL